ncbi:MAG: cytochrome P450 [Nannocystaceae bacterium]|nr:cytochrome P450 [Nannocystaceae bacterium]
MFGWLAAGASLLPLTGYWAALRGINGHRRTGEPPLVRGFVPYLGVGVPFGKDATSFVQRCQVEHGDVFTLFIAGERMTFVLNPLSTPAVLKAKQLSFLPVSDSIIERAFKIPSIRNKLDLEELEVIGRTRLRGERLEELSSNMALRLKALIPQVASEAWQSAQLYEVIWDIMFRAGTQALFGRDTVTPELRADFEVFDRQFPMMVAGLPGPFVKAGNDALHRLGRAKLPGKDPSHWIRDRQPIIDALPEDDRGRMRLPALWAIHANTIPSTFWTLYWLLRHPDALAAVHAEVKAHSSEAGGPKVCDLSDLKLLDSAIHEALRLSSGSLTIREVLENFLFETEGGTHKLRRGDRVCLAPFITHRDPDVFEDPLEYKYDRFYAEEGRKQFYKDGKRVPLPLMPFGAGSSMCPGRFFAVNEIKLFMTTVLTHWDIELGSDPHPAFEFGRAGLGIYPPAHDVSVRIRRVQPLG